MPATAPPHELDEAAILRACAQHAPPALAVRAGPGSARVVWVGPGLCDLLVLDPVDVLDQELAHVGPALFPTSPTTPGITLEDQPRPDWRVALRHLVAGGEAGVATAVVQAPDDSCVTVTVHARPIGPGNLWVAVLTPLPEPRVRLQEALAEAEHRFTALADYAPIGIMMSRAGLRLGYVNRFLTSLAGRSADRLLGTGWLDMVHSEDLPSVYELVQAVLAGEQGERTVRLTPVGDTQRWVRLRLAPVTTVRRAAGFIATVEDITSRRAWEEQLAYQAGHDPLTGLANRRRLVEEIATLLDSRRLRDRDFAVLFCDLDGFKQVNDRWGHDAGDRVLIDVARMISRTARDQDLVARLAGDEFVVVLRQVEGVAGAESAARRHLHGLSGEVSVAGERVRLSASLGVALPSPGDTPESLLRTADRLMYLAKQAGSGGYLLSEPPPSVPGRADDPGPPGSADATTTPRTHDPEAGPR
ncbi:MAG: diguanylate cyclase [Kineosporiaceae bacterium]